MSDTPDPLDAIEDFDAEDPNPEPITDPAHPDYIEPAADVRPRARKES